MRILLANTFVQRPNRWLMRAAGLCAAIPCLACAAPLDLSGTTDSTPSNHSVFKLSRGDSFTAVVDLDIGAAKGHSYPSRGISKPGVQYTGIRGKIEANIGGVEWSFTPYGIMIDNDFVDDARKRYPRPADIWELMAKGPDGLILIIGLVQHDGSAIDDEALFLPAMTEAFDSATWYLAGPSYDPATGHQLPKLDTIGAVQSAAGRYAGISGL